MRNRVKEAGLLRVRTINPKARTSVKACEPHVPSVVGEVNELAEDHPEVDSNLIPTSDSSSHGLAAEPSGRILYRDLPLEARHMLLDLGPQSLSRPPDLSHGAITFKQPFDPSYPPTDVRSEGPIVPLGSLVVNPARVAGTRPFPTPGFDPSPGAEVKDGGRLLGPHSQLRLVTVPLYVGNYNVQLDDFIGLFSSFAAVCAMSWEGMMLTLPDDPTRPVRQRPGSGTYMITTVMLDRDIPKLIAPRGHDAAICGHSPSPMAGSLHKAFRGRSLCAELATNCTHTTVPATPLSHWGFPCRHIPCKSTEGFMSTISVVVRRSTAAQLLERSVPAHPVLPLAWSMVRHLFPSWRLGHPRGAPVLGIFCFSTLSWDHNTSAGSSRFGHAPDSGQAPGKTYPNVRDGGGIGSGSKAAPYLGAHGDEANLYDTERLFGEGTVDLPSTLSYAPTGISVPQQRDFVPETPIPLDAYGPHQWSHVGEYDYGSSFASVPAQTWPTIVSNGYTDTWGDLYRSAPAPPSPRGQQVNAFQTEQLLNPSHNVTDSFAPSVGTTNQSTNFHRANDRFQIPNTSRVVQPEPQAPDFHPDSNSTPVDSVEITEWTQLNWQHPHGDNLSACGGSFSACATGVAFAASASSAHPVPVSCASPKSKPSLKVPGGVHTCSLCGRSFRRPYLLKDHMNSRHKQGQPHRCKYPGCSSVFTSRSNLKRHWSEKHQDTDDSHTKSNYIQTSDAVNSWVGSGGLGDANPQSSVICQHSTRVSIAPPTEESALPEETTPAQQPVLGSSAPSTTGIPYLDFLFANVDSSEDREWARGAQGPIL